MDNARRSLLQLGARRHPVVIGTGLVALDVVIPNSLVSKPHCYVGGTCGNVLTVLSFLGWRSFPIARLSADAASRLVTDDLRRWDVKLNFVTFDDDGSTPVVIQHIRNNRSGDPVHSFSRKCPSCGAPLPWYKPVRVADLIDLVPRLPKPQVFFLDRTSRGALSLANQARDRGAMVVFEPSASSDPQLLNEALELAHIVKVSADRIGGNEAVLTSTQPKVVIETLGSSGLRLRINGSTRGDRKWHKLPPIPTEVLKDAAGAGDWCTAGIIHTLGAMGAQGFDSLKTEMIEHAVRVGQAMASWSCRFDGPRGGMYVCDKAAFRKSIRDLLEGKAQTASKVPDAAIRTVKGKVFACESCRKHTNKTRIHSRESVSRTSA